MPETTLKLSGGDAVVHYDVTGTGPGLLLLHGTATNREQWLPLTALAREEFTVVAPDFSGSGRTTDHGGPVTIDDLAREALAAADDAGLETFALAGHSLGAAVAAHLAGTHPDRVRSLVLHAAWVRTDTRMDAEFRFWLDLLAAGPELFARMLPLMAFGPGYWARTSAAENEALVAALSPVIEPGTDRQIEADRTVDLRGVLGGITAPTLVLASEHDRLIDAAQQLELVEAIRNSHYALFPAGHGAPAEDPDAFNQTILSFVGSAALVG